MPSSSSFDHKALVRQEFTQQAPDYAVNPVVKDNERLLRLVHMVQPAPQAQVLDVATGPGYVAMAFAEANCQVVGIDLTEAPLAIAETMRQARGLTNLRFQLGDAEHLPFAAHSFDIVVSRLALHHCEDAQQVLTEMARVCRPLGQVVVEDLVSSEFPARAAYQNHCEQLRDPSHTRALTISDFLVSLRACNLEIEHLCTDERSQPVERWLANAHTPAAQAMQVRDLLTQDEQHDLSGLHPFRRDGALYLCHQTATFVARKRENVFA